ncbi:hypothetical protein RRG08_057501 [Elysia crispata]|uniref:Uncharacterized protein n=1 Tax=Elysia crispata TaxID=231223 RepID=A0AAE1DKM4_9GAST|nr:hypothetical protein RRG08_057501 [Elysia crispata]
MATTNGIYNSTSPQDVEPPSVYQDLEPNHLTSGDTGPYSNVSGAHVGISEIHSHYRHLRPQIISTLIGSSVTGNP